MNCPDPCPYCREGFLDSLDLSRLGGAIAFAGCISYAREVAGHSPREAAWFRGYAAALSDMLDDTAHVSSAISYNADLF